MLTTSLFRNSTSPTQNKSEHSLITWSIAGVLLTFFLLTQSLVMLNFLPGWKSSALITSAAFILSVLIVYWFLQSEVIQFSKWFLISAISLVIFIASIIISGLFYDMSWDGLWYHQTAVYQMAHGWNPIYDPMHNFNPHLQDWVRHYAKGPWYVALALYNITGDIESAKAAPWIALCATFFTIYSVLIDFGFRRRVSILISALVSFNPVTVFELASFLVDGLMISFLACFVAAMFSWIRQQSKFTLWIMFASAVLCINTKQTGLVYLCFSIAAGGLYVLLNKRELVKKYIAIQLAAILCGVFVLGFNPYVTNTIHRGNPFYPMLGSNQYPGLAEQGEDPIEKWETPHNMMGTSRFTRLAYAVLGRPGAQPYYPGTDASFMIPFDIGWKDFEIYYFHDVRISGFGPLFSGVFLISLILICSTLIKPIIPREITILFIGTIIVSLLISQHTWWARYGPQLWWIPIFALILGYINEGSKLVRSIKYILTIILMLNIIPIFAVHYKWEVDATNTTNKQLNMLKQYDNVEIDFQYFEEPFGERLKAGGIRFTRAQNFQCKEPLELMSVSPGYPCAVRACVNNH